MTIQVAGANGAAGKMTLPEGFGAFAAAESPVLLCDLPSSWLAPLFGRKRPKRLTASDAIEALLDPTEGIPTFDGGDDRQLAAIEAEQFAGELLIAAGKFPVGWHVPGPGNLTQLLIGWANQLVAQLGRGEREAVVRSLGGVGSAAVQKLRWVDVLGMLRGVPERDAQGTPIPGRWTTPPVPIRMGGSFNGVPVGRSTLGGLALVCVALTSRRVQDCIKQSVEKVAEYGNDATDKDGWPAIFTPKMAYGQMSAFAQANVEQFTGHVTCSFRPGQFKPELDLLAAKAGMVAHVIGQDLAAGRCHIPHDQLKNSSVGQGTRGAWLVDGQVISLCAAGSKPEKALNRQKLLTGNGAVLLQRQGSKLRIQVD